MVSILVAGSGGQGILFLGKLLAQGAMLEGKNVTWFPSYGAEMRGGTANCTVVISDEMIGSPVVKSLDILIAFNEASFKKFHGRVRQNGLIILDSSLIKGIPSRQDIRIVGVPASEIAVSLGSVMSANMVILGALIVKDKLIKEESIMRAVEELTPPHKEGALELNKRAINKGKEYLNDKKG